MMVIAIVSLVAYNIFIFFYLKRLFPLKREHWLYYAAAIALNIGAFLISDIWDLHQIGVFLILGSTLLIFKLLFRMKGLQVLCTGGMYMFSLYSSRGIIVSLYAIILKNSIAGVLRNEVYYYTIIVLAVLYSMLIFTLIRKTIVPLDKMKQLLCNREQLKFAVIYLFLLIIYLLLVNDGRFWGIRPLWFSTLYLISFTMGKLGLLFVLNHTIRVSVLMEYELHTRQLQEQLERQIRHYKSYQRYTESFRAFKHDYKDMMASVKTLIKNHENEKAVKLIDDIHDTMQKSVLVHKTYSNNVLLDAVLQDAANTCEENHIRFSSFIYLPLDMILSELHIIRIFANVLNNAIEACCKVPALERFIEITSSGNQDWTMIEVANSFNGEVILAGEELKTTKKNKDFHGLGLNIIKDIIESMGGLVWIDADQDKRVFTIKLHIPQASQEKPS
ncbi:sensor histidine kinase [Geosporobacter ferrireducens]|uniref:Histidine kinase n=1 Tax=Geosporobacter ferrireducens TaxID=1424294 RepID=A0A1D8GLN8_9FIRM|nr:ATP-binding protein [Geosporobacter ferrireducens]AOT71823.1 histidine kinase [Geosporobacter ferrireducens]MTI55609.1 sensor histidine kinase [Geosporobacter ferrireducens]